jgi:hypothetical protein
MAARDKKINDTVNEEVSIVATYKYHTQSHWCYRQQTNPDELIQVKVTTQVNDSGKSLTLIDANNPAAPGTGVYK